MIFVIASFIFVSILSSYYFLYWNPKKRIETFAKKAEQLGYKVKLMPFAFMNYYLIKYMQQDNKSLRIFKEQFVQYDLIVGNFFTSLSVLIIHPQLIKHTFNQSNKLPKIPFVSQVFHMLNGVNGCGIPFSQGQTWKRKRRIISSVFHFDFLNDMIPIIQEQINTQFKKFDQHLKKNENINIRQSLTKILSSIITKCFFGTDMLDYQIQGKPYCEYYVKFLDQISTFTTSLQHILLGTTGYKYGLTRQSRHLKKKYQILENIAKQVTLKQLEKIKNNQYTKRNMISSLYQNGLLRDGGQSNPDKYTIQQLIGQFFAFYGAGTDTTANSINLVLHYLSQNSIYVHNIRNQLIQLSKDSIMKKSQKLKSMKWIDAVFNETLRLNGPAPGIFQRTASLNLNIGQLQIPKGTSVSIQFMPIHYNKLNYQNHIQFYPQRWLKDIKIQPYTYLPFGGGERNCIGQYLARIQAKLLISRIIEKYDFKAIYPIEMKAGFVYSTQHGQFQMKLNVLK